MAAARRLCAHREHGPFYEGLAEELIAWARHQFELDAPAKDGSAREHLAGALKRARTDQRRRELARELAGPPFPRPLRYLWALFMEIADGLKSGDWGPPVVTWESLAAWSQLAGVDLEPREARLLVRLGVVRAVVTGKRRGE